MLETMFTRVQECQCQTAQSSEDRQRVFENPFALGGADVRRLKLKSKIRNPKSEK